MHLSVFARAALGLLVFSSGCAALDGGAFGPLAVVDDVDIERYMGRWYEIAKYPNSFQRDCYGVTADYTLRADGTVGVENTCRTQDGSQVARSIAGFAKIADPDAPAKLTVYFFWPFGAPYWIIDLDESYTYAVVGDPSRRFLWILSRTPTMDEATYAAIVSRLPDMGYDPNRLERTVQFP